MHRATGTPRHIHTPSMLHYPLHVSSQPDSSASTSTLPSQHNTHVHAQSHSNQVSGHHTSTLSLTHLHPNLHRLRTSTHTDLHPMISQHRHVCPSSPNNNTPRRSLNTSSLTHAHLNRLLPAAPLAALLYPARAVEASLWPAPTAPLSPPRSASAARSRFPTAQPHAIRTSAMLADVNGAIRFEFAYRRVKEAGLSVLEKA
eukprot:931216-Rhodomonas_salina.1